MLNYRIFNKIQTAEQAINVDSRTVLCHLEGSSIIRVGESPLYLDLQKNVTLKDAHETELERWFTICVELGSNNDEQN